MDEHTQPPQGYDADEWQDFMAELRELLQLEQDTKWAVGDCLVRRVHPATVRTVADGVNNGRDEVLRQASREQDMPVATLKDRYVTSLKFSPANRGWKVAWTVYRQFADRENSLAAMTEFMADRTHATKRQASEHLGSAEGSAGGREIARSINDTPDMVDKVHDTVAHLTPDAKEVLAKELAKQAPVTVTKALNESDAGKEVTRRAKETQAWTDAREERASEQTFNPMWFMTVLDKALDGIDEFNALVHRTRDTMTDEHVRICKMVAASLHAKANVLAAEFDGTLEPLSDADFADAVAALTNGGV